MITSIGTARAQIGIDLMRPPITTRSVAVDDRLPQWVAMPDVARILASDGVELRPLKNSAVTLENARLGVLVGALRNAGPCARDLTLRLQYTDEYWAPLGEPIENEARVSRVEPGGVLPYRFRLRRREDFTVQPSGYILQVAEGDRPVARPVQFVETTRAVDTSPCPPSPLAIATTVRKHRSTLSGYRIEGTFVVDSGGPLRPDGLMLTALLLDQEGNVLEVLTGVPVPKAKDIPTGVIENGKALPFALSTAIPLGKAVATTMVFTEMLPDAQVAPPQ